MRESVLLYLSGSFQFFLCWERDRERGWGDLCSLFFSAWISGSGLHDRHVWLVEWYLQLLDEVWLPEPAFFAWLFSSSQQKIDLPTFFVGRRRMRGLEGMGTRENLKWKWNLSYKVCEHDKYTVESFTRLVRANSILYCCNKSDNVGYILWAHQTGVSSRF